MLRQMDDCSSSQTFLKFKSVCVLLCVCLHYTKALPQCTCFTGVELHFKAALPEATGGSRVEPEAEWQLLIPGME